MQHSLQGYCTNRMYQYKCMNANLNNKLKNVSSLKNTNNNMILPKY